MASITRIDFRLGFCLFPTLDAIEQWMFAPFDLFEVSLVPNVEIDWLDTRDLAATWALNFNGGWLVIHPDRPAEPAEPRHAAGAPRMSGN